MTPDFKHILRIVIGIRFSLPATSFTARQSLIVKRSLHPRKSLLTSPAGQRKAISIDHEKMEFGCNATSSNQNLGYVLKQRNPYDVHVYYSNPEEREAALELRTKLHDEFGDWMRFYNPKDRPIGPHPVPMWEADFGGYEHRHKFEDVCDFFRQHNQDPKLSVLIHPHSTDSDYADHTEYAFWDGPILPLRIGGWRR